MDGLQKNFVMPMIMNSVSVVKVTKEMCEKLAIISELLSALVGKKKSCTCVTFTCRILFTSATIAPVRYENECIYFTFVFDFSQVS